MPLRQRLESGLVLVALATFCLAFKGIFARLAYEDGLSVDNLLLLRFLFAVPLFLLGARWLNRGKPRVRLTRKQWGWAGLTGMLFFLSALFDFNAINLLGASVSRLILYVFPALVMLLQSVLTRRLPPLRQGMAFVVAWLGIALVLSPGWHGGGMDPWGVACGFGAASCYAVFWHISQPLTRELGSVRFNEVSNSFTLVAMLIFLMPVAHLNQLPHVQPMAWVWVLALVVLTTVLPFFLLFEGLRRADAGEAGVVAMFGPVVTVLGAWVAVGERLSPIQWAGLVVVLGAMAFMKARRKPGAVNATADAGASTR